MGAGTETCRKPAATDADINNGFDLFGGGDSVLKLVQDNDATLAQAGNTATGGAATATGGAGGDADSGNVQDTNGNVLVDGGGDTEADSGNAIAGDGGDAIAIGGDAEAENEAVQVLDNDADVDAGVDGVVKIIQDNDATLTQEGNTATGGAARSTGGAGGDAGTGNTQSGNGNVGKVPVIVIPDKPTFPGKPKPPGPGPGPGPVPPGAPGAAGPAGPAGPGGPAGPRTEAPTTTPSTTPTGGPLPAVAPTVAPVAAGELPFTGLPLGLLGLLGALLAASGGGLRRKLD